MCVLKIFTHPVNEMVLEDPLDELMEEVGSDQFVYICTGKMLSEWLRKQIRVWLNGNEIGETYYSIFDDSVCFPKRFHIECGLACFSMLWRSEEGIQLVEVIWV